MRIRLVANQINWIF